MIIRFITDWGAEKCTYFCKVMMDLKNAFFSLKTQVKIKKMGSREILPNKKINNLR